MAKKYTQEEFEEKANNIHGGKYTYGKYNGSHKKMDIFCPIHGKFQKRANMHLFGQGCKKCANISRNEKNTYTQEEFEEKANNIHGGKYTYGKYNGSHKKMDIFCPIHGKFPQQPTQHLFGSSCPECGNIESALKHTHTQEEFEEKANNIHGGKYTYGKYNGSINEMDIFCPIHGKFSQLSDAHLHSNGNGNGCPECARILMADNLRHSQEEFEKIVNKKHNNKYTYGKYTGRRNEMDIFCPIHGKFTQKAHLHLIGSGCLYCANDRKGWTHHKWVERGENSTSFDSFKTYVIECFNDEERFIKTGKTFKTIKRRFGEQKIETKNMPYKYQILSIFEDEDGMFISKLEKELQREFKENKYTPLKKFGGSTECFNVNIKKDLLNYIKNLEL